MGLLVSEVGGGGWAPLLPAAAAASPPQRGGAVASTTTPAAALLAAAEAHPGLAAAAASFLARPPVSLPEPASAAGPPPAVCVLQGEVAFLPSSVAGGAAALASGDATTCVIAAAASAAGVSLAHCDAGTATPRALDQLLAPHVAGGGGGGRDHRGHDAHDHPISLFLVGGAAVGPATGADAGPAVGAALLAAAAARPEPLRLALALVGACNTTDARHPRASSLGLRAGAGAGAAAPAPFPAAFTDRGPAVPLRLARLWAPPPDGEGGEGEGGVAAAVPARRLVPIVRGGGGDGGGRGGSLELTISPLGGCGSLASDGGDHAPPPARHARAGLRSRSPRAAQGSSGPASAGRLTPLATQAAALASLPDADLLAAASTSPASEPAHFVADLRAALSVLREDGGGGGGGSGGGGRGASVGGAGTYHWSRGRWVRR